MQKLLLPQADEVGLMAQCVQQTPFEKIVYDQIKTLNIRMEVSNEDSIISSDNPIVAFIEDNNYFQIRINKIIFPIDIAIMIQPTISYSELITYPFIINDSVDKQQAFFNMVDEYGWNKSLIEIKKAFIATQRCNKINSDR